MRKKVFLLYFGLTLVLIGVIFRSTFDINLWSSLLISVGGVLKFTYLFISIRRRNYKPGIELLFLGVGVASVISGSYLRGIVGLEGYSLFFTIGGIIFKVVFLVKFFIKVRAVQFVKNWGAFFIPEKKQRFIK